MRFVFSAVGIMLIYAVFGAAWVLGGDWLLGHIGLSEHQAEALQSAKGLAFVGISALVIFGLLRSEGQKTLAAQSERRHVYDVLENAIGNTNRPFYTWDSKTGIVFLSGGAALMAGLGSRPITLTNDGWRALLHPDDLPLILDTIQPKDAAHDPRTAPDRIVERTFRIRHANGTYLWVRALAAVLIGDDPSEWKLSGNLIDITDIRRKEEEAERANTALRALVAANRAIILAHSRETMFESVCRSIAETGNYPLVWVGIPRHDDAKSVEIVAAAGEKADYLDGIEVSWDGASAHGNGPTGRAIRDKELHRTNFAGADPRVSPWSERAVAFGLISSVTIPIPNQDRSAGVLNVYSRVPDAFSALNEVVFTNIGEDIGFSLQALDAAAALRASETQKEHALAQVRDMLVKVVTTLGRSIGARDPYTAGHQVRVAELSVAIARTMGRCGDAGDPDDMAEMYNVLRLGALIHDIGKLGIPADLLTKPSRLAPEEFALLKRHPTLGAAIIRDAGLPPAISAIIEQHHERFDGSGYPRGIAGEDIALEARIVGVADVVEAIMAHRPYRPSLGMDKALSEIEEGSGTRYDPAVASACLTLFRDHRFEFSPVPRTDMAVQ